MKYIEKHLAFAQNNIGNIHELYKNIQIHCKNIPKIRLKKTYQNKSKHINTQEYITA